MDMRCNASRSMAYDAAGALLLMLFGTWAAAQSPALSNIDLCNGMDRASAERQIVGCTALITSGAQNPQLLAIARNNRGNAYTAEGKYDLAIQDYDESIKLDPKYAKPLNNRGVVYQRKGDYDRAAADFDAAIDIDPK